MATIGKQVMLAAAVTLAAVPAMAAPANPAASLSLGNARVGTPVQHDAKLAGKVGRKGLIFGIVGAIVILAVVLIATNNTPTSV